METITDLDDQWIRNISNNIETEEGKSKKGTLWIMYLLKLETYSEPCQTSKMERFSNIGNGYDR